MKSFLFSILLFLCVISGGCAHNIEPKPSDHVSPASSSLSSPNPKSAVFYDIITKTPKDDSFVYYNETYGYELYFPRDWLGCYYITESESGAACVMYYGHQLTEDETSRVSFPLFYVCTPLDECYDTSGKYIGTSKNHQLYLAEPETEPTGFYLGEKARYNELKAAFNIVMDTFRSDVAESARTISQLTNQTCIVTSEKYGYTIKFPDSWAGWFYAIEQESGIIEIIFYGKSELMSAYFNGEAMLQCLVAEEHLAEGIWDSQKVIGHTSKTTIYASGGSGGGLDGFFIHDFSNVSFLKTSEEKRLIDEDEKMVNKMLGDLLHSSFEFMG